MTQLSPHLSIGQAFYLFLLRGMGWLGLLFVLFFAFAWSTGNLRPGVSMALIVAGSAPGMLVSLFLAGTPARPTMLLRPTSFLKAFFVCGFFVSLASTAIMIQVFSLIVPLDIGGLFMAMGFAPPEHAIIKLLTSLYGQADIAALRAGGGMDLSVALFLTLPGAVIGNITAWTALFIRFERTVAPPKPPRQRNQSAEIDEAKARALRAMRQRQIARQAG